MQIFVCFGLYNDITMRVSKAENCSSHEMVHLKVPGFVLDFIVLLAIKLPAFFLRIQE